MLCGTNKKSVILMFFWFASERQSPNSNKEFHLTDNIINNEISINVQCLFFLSFWVMIIIVCAMFMNLLFNHALHVVEQLERTKNDVRLGFFLSLSFQASSLCIMHNLSNEMKWDAINLKSSYDAQPKCNANCDTTIMLRLTVLNTDCSQYEQIQRCSVTHYKELATQSPMY